MAPFNTEAPPISSHPTAEHSDQHGGLLFKRISHSIKDKQRNRRKGDESSTSLHYCDIVDSSCYNAPEMLEERPSGHHSDHHETFVPQNADHYLIQSHPIKAIDQTEKS